MSKTQTLSISDRRAAARKSDGVRYAHVARSSGSLITFVRNDEVGLDTSAGEYSAVCEDHSQSVTGTLQVVKSYGAVPEQWCSGCAKQALARQQDAGMRKSA